MALSIKLNGQKLDLDANPDLLFHLLLGLTNLEERLNSIDKRLYNLEKKAVKINTDNLVSSSQYMIKKG